MNGIYILLSIFCLAHVPATLLSSVKQSTKNNVVQPVVVRQEACPICPNFVCPPCGGGTGGTGVTGPTGIICPTGLGGVGATLPTSLGACVTVTDGGIIDSVTTNCVDIQNDLVVALNVNVKEDLQICEDLDVRGDSCVVQDLKVDEDVNIGGATIILGDLTVNDGATINDFLIVNGNATVNGSINATGNLNINQMITVGGNARIEGLLTATGGVSVFEGMVINNGGLQVTNIDCTGAPTGCTGAIINGNVCIVGDELVLGDKLVEELTVDELAIFNNVTVGVSGATEPQTLITNGPVIMNNGLTIASGDQVLSTGDLILRSGNLFVNNPAAISTFNGSIEANAGAVINNGLLVNGGENVALGDLDVTMGNVSVDGALVVNGSIVGFSTGTFGSLLITDTTNAESPTGPAALIVNGGAGIVKDKWLGGSIFFANVASGPTGTGIPSAFNYYEEACFSTQFVWGGVPTTPPAAVQIKIVRVGNVVNLLIPPIIINNPGAHIDVVSSFRPLPIRFRPCTTVRGASSTIIYNIPDADPFTPDIFGELGEFDISPQGIITFGLSRGALGPQRILSTDFVMVDANTITYNVNCCDRTCKLPSFGPGFLPVVC